MQKSIGAVHWVFAWPFFVLALTGAGCMHSELGDPNPYYSVTQEKDIPAPRDFLFDKDRSYTYTLYRDPKGIGSFRNTTLYYYGDQHVGKLIPWYQEQMRADGWNYKENRDDQDRRCLVFTKTNETATIQIYREFDKRKDRYMTFVQAEIHPTRTEEMASDELMNAPLPLGPDGKAGGEPQHEGAIPADDDASPLPAGADESSIIMTPAPSAPRSVASKAVASKAPASKAAAQPLRSTSAKIAPQEDKQVVNEEMGAENSEESVEELPAEDEDSEK
jgi:hypothetical protein